MRIGRPLAFAALVLLVVAVLVLGVLLGNVPLDPGQVVLALLQAVPGLEGVGGPVDPTVSVIVMNIRLPRVLLGIMVGAALGVAGCAMQGLLKNPLADPYLFGVSAGAAVGSAAAAVTGFFILGALTGPAVAFLGAILATALVYQVSQVGGQLPVEGVLLAGVAIGSLLAAIASAIPSSGSALLASERCAATPEPVTCTPWRWTVLNPASVKEMPYVPGGRSVMRYCPVLSLTADRTFSIKAGLDASTVAPGSTAPDVSRTTPARVACA